MTVLIYFTVLSLVFLIGLFQISHHYQLFDAPVDGGFSAKFNWVATFAYLYIIPLIILFSNKGFRRANDRFYSSVSRIMVKVLLVAAFIAGGYIAMFGFVLTYYGFAP
ncbi:hypothetical protein [Jeotgalibacillus haloalkalitolerans]|uniref:DUF1648 domain-containing protein n=1 Tax=Jeotgalibacillus haloalkalitolerans TaxID=3104292 RepID=A0ABU5KNK8_9BACL|nr:hypothetical protein [Jeotgalibacillus sp. HH7-29]MDZ5712853.1 hypothetical protein [Jeotgalibacillus sp. HH7-29]